MKTANEQETDNIIRNLDNYSTSTDYRALWALAQVQSIVCIIEGREWTKDGEFAPVVYGGERQNTVARTIWDGRNCRVTVPGTCYVESDEGRRESFEDQCALYNLRWIPPGRSAVDLARALITLADRNEGVRIYPAFEKPEIAADVYGGPTYRSDDAAWTINGDARELAEQLLELADG